MIRMLCCGLVVWTALSILGGEARAEQKKLEVKVLYQGSNDDANLAGKAPASNIITTQKAFDELFAAWKLGEQKPIIDFKKDAVVVVTTVGSRITLLTTLDTDKGNLNVLGLATKDLRPGFRYVVGVISSDGIKTVNGKELPKE